MTADIKLIKIRLLENDPIKKIEIIAPDDLWVISSFLNGISLFGLRFCAEALVNRHGFGTEASDFEYPDELEDDEIDPNNLLITSFESEIQVNQIDFEHLMLDFFEKMILAVLHYSPEIREEPWWKEYTDFVNELKARVKT